MKVLIADKFQASGVEALKGAGCEVLHNPDLTADDLAGAVADAAPDVLVVRSTKVRAEVFERATKLSLVVRAGAGYDTIDVGAASNNGIFVANCPGKNSVAVAELAWGLILACDRMIPNQTAELRDGKWNKKLYSKAAGLYGRTLGVVGVGRIAEAVIERARAFGMPVVAWSRSLDDEKAAALGVRRVAGPAEVAREADVVSVHVASTPETKHLVDAEFCAALKPGAIFVNTTRGAVVDEAALLAAVRDQGVRAGLDVYEREPAAGDKASDIAIAREPGVVGTHHIGASTDQAQEAIAAETVRIVRVFLERGSAPNVVNLETKSPAKRLLAVRHINRPGVLAHVVGEIGRADINIEEMENVIYLGGGAACARIRLDAEPGEATMASIREGSEHVLSVDLTEIA